MLNRNLFHNFDVETFQGDDLARMVCEQAYFSQAQVGENLGADSVLVLELTLACLLYTSPSPRDS